MVAFILDKVNANAPFLHNCISQALGIYWLYSNRAFTKLTLINLTFNLQTPKNWLIDLMRWNCKHQKTGSITRTFKQAAVIAGPKIFCLLLLYSL